MNFLTLCQTARQECGVQGQGPAAVTNQTGLLKKIIDWVIKSDIYIQSLHADWDFLWAEFSGNTTLGSADITKPANFGQWDTESFSVNRGLATGRKLTLIDFKKYRENYNIKTSQPPQRITILPTNNLRLDQPADGTYAICADYWKKVTALAADADIPPYPDRFHWVIIERVKMFYYADQEAFDLYKQAKIEYDAWIEKLEAWGLPGMKERSKAQVNPETMTVRPV